MRGLLSKAAKAMDAGGKLSIRPKTRELEPPYLSEISTIRIRKLVIVRKIN